MAIELSSLIKANAYIQVDGHALPRSQSLHICNVVYLTNTQRRDTAQELSRAIFILNPQSLNSKHVSKSRATETWQADILDQLL